MGWGWFTASTMTPRCHFGRTQRQVTPRQAVLNGLNCVFLIAMLAHDQCDCTLLLDNLQDVLTTDPDLVLFAADSNKNCYLRPGGQIRPHPLVADLNHTTINKCSSRQGLEHSGLKCQRKVFILHIFLTSLANIQVCSLS